MIFVFVGVELSSKNAVSKHMMLTEIIYKVNRILKIQF